jgi:hypothetical protein
MRASIAIACLVAGSAFAADVKFYQTVDRNEVGTEDTFRLTIVVGNAPEGATPQFPAPRDFEVMSRSQSTQMSYSFSGGGPGTIERIVKYVLVMRANRPGKLTLPAAVLSTANRTYKTEPIEMTVKAGQVKDPHARPPRPQSPFGQLPDPFQNFPFPQMPDLEPDDEGPPAMSIPRSDSDLFVKSIVDREAAYVGDQITLSVWAFSRVDLSGINNMSTPKLDGFWSQDDGPAQLTQEQRVLNGIPYRAYLLKRWVLYPVKTGNVVIGPAGVDIDTGMLFSQHRVHRESTEVTIRVKPLPPGAPPGFSPSNVGRWRLSTEVSQSQMELGQPVTFRVTLDGRGNLKNVAPPPLTGPPALKIYEPTTTDKSVSNHGKFGGRRVTEYLVVGQQTGTFELPGLEFPYFDPETGKYEVSRTDPVRLTVLPGGGLAGKGPAGGVGANAAAAVKNVLAAGGLKPLRAAASFAVARAPEWRKPFFLPVVAGPAGLWLAMSVVGLVRGSLMKEDAGARRKRKAREARKRLAQAEQLRRGGLPAAFYGEVEKALQGFLEAKLGTPVSGLTRDVLSEQMKAAGVKGESAQKILAVLDACDAGRFAPGVGDAVRSQVLDQAGDAMETWGAK